MHREKEVHSANSGRTGYKSNRTKKIVIVLMLAILAVAGILAFIVFANPFRSGSDVAGPLKNPLGVNVTQNAQKVTVTADKHVSSSANAYMVDLYSGGGSDIHLDHSFMKDGTEAHYKYLNPGEQYVIIVRECRRSKKWYKRIKDSAATLIKVVPLEPDTVIYGEDAGESVEPAETKRNKDSKTAKKSETDRGGASAGLSADDFQNEAKKTDDKVQGKVYPDKEKIRRILENAAIERKKALSFYYPEKVPDFAFTDGSLLLDDEISSIAYTWYYYNDKNDYDQRITIMGREYYRYDFHFDYHYSSAKQKRYLPKILEIKKQLKGTEAEKIKKFDAYFRKNCVYDDSLTKGDPFDAIVGGEAVCDGYARAAYLLMNMAGAPCEYIYGRGNGGRGWESHAWNLNKIGSKWYQSDFTWDSSLGNTSFLLKGGQNKKFNRMHVKAGKFKKEKWVKEHPMSKKDY